MDTHSAYVWVGHNMDNKRVVLQNIMTVTESIDNNVSRQLCHKEWSDYALRSNEYGHIK